MSTHIEGIKPPDDKWIRMKQVFDACVKADIEIPNEVLPKDIKILRFTNSW